MKGIKSIYKSHVKRIKSTYGIPVSEVKKHHYSLMGNEGSFTINYKRKTLCIVLYKKLSVAKKLGILLHEEGHLKCFMDNCFCYRSFRQREIHANCYALKSLMEENLTKVLVVYMDMIRDIHSPIIDELKESRLWQCAEQFIQVSKTQNSPLVQ